MMYDLINELLYVFSYSDMHIYERLHQTQYVLEL